MVVLVDTSVWIDHLRRNNAELANLLNDGDVVCHPFVIGELACGNLGNRAQILSLLNTLPAAIQAKHEEIMQFIENYYLMGQGLGYIDVHLLASALLTQVSLWTFDKKLNEVSARLEIAFK